MIITLIYNIIVIYNVNVLFPFWAKICEAVSYIK